MPAAKKKYYDRKDIEIILDIKKTKALEILHMFEVRGQLFRCDGIMRVKITDFEVWEDEQIIGNDPASRQLRALEQRAL